MLQALCLVFSTSVFFSCSESIIVIDIPAHEPRLVLTALMTDPALKRKNFFSFTSSSAIQESKNTLEKDPFSSGDFQLIIDGNNTTNNFYDRITYFPNINMGRLVVKDLHPFEYGKNYQFDANIEGYPSVSARQTMPYPPSFIAANFDGNINIDGKFTPYFTASLTFDDPANQTDFYKIQAYIVKRHNQTETYPIWTWSNEEYLSLESYYDNSLVLNDETFNGQEHQITLRIDSRFVKEEDILILNFARMTEDNYRFHRSYRQFIIAQETPFSEPITTYSNVENGFGIFGLEASTIITIRP